MAQLSEFISSHPAKKKSTPIWILYWSHCFWRVVYGIFMLGDGILPHWPMITVDARPWDPPRDRTPWWWWSTWCPMVPTNQHVAWILKKHHKFKRVRCIYQKYTDIFVKLLCKALLVGGLSHLPRWKMMEWKSVESHKTDIPVSTRCWYFNH